MSPLVVANERVKIRKIDSSLEKFDRTKLIESILKAGASHESAVNVIEKLLLWDKIESQKIRSQVYVRLLELDINAAEDYRHMRKIRAEANAHVVYDCVQINPRTLRMIELRPGTNLRLMHDDHVKDAIVESWPEVPVGEVWLNPVALYSLNAKEGDKVAFQY